MANVTDVTRGAHCYVTWEEYRKWTNWFSRFSPYRQSLLWCYWCIQGSSLVGWGCCVVSTGKASQSLVDFPILRHNVTHRLCYYRYSFSDCLFGRMPISRSSWLPRQLFPVITTVFHLILAFLDGSFCPLLTVGWSSSISFNWLNLFI